MSRDDLVKIGYIVFKSHLASRRNQPEFLGVAGFISKLIKRLFKIDSCHISEESLS
ncbi:hypothetical protein P5G62_023750 [Neobacillus sp. 179-C4.2 HS]|uniref:Uncharacterized protein n=1 Tax=Neobacillus driksii TaxID=3035913 RepID=A0ABV4Z0F7_9BACI|nr:hypothetical protein [Neobacillus sp. 179.-C4.2 HS]MDP5194710.1 hypothetical protein [Neobacillus sp. 179.-C4.2 HS]